MASSDEADPHRRLLTIVAAGAAAGVGLVVAVPAAALLAGAVTAGLFVSAMHRLAQSIAGAQHKWLGLEKKLGTSGSKK